MAAIKSVKNFFIYNLNLLNYIPTERSSSDNSNRMTDKLFYTYRMR